jgi:hypothetical protein
MIIDETDPMFGQHEWPICSDFDPAKLTGIEKANYELADRINREALANPQSCYAGKFVGIANGQVVVVADTLDAVSRALRESEPDSTRCFIVEASRDYGVVEEIWGFI